MHNKLFLIPLVVLLPWNFIGAQQESPADLHKSCSGFVQRFYDWYVPEVMREGSVRAENLALKSRTAWFDPELSRQLMEDAGAQAKVKGETVGLDFDPFLNSQDPDGRYVVASTEVKDGRCRASIHGVRSGKEIQTPSVAPELERKENRWIFVNFHYPDSERAETENLLAVLRNFRELRRKYPNRDK